MEDTSKDQSNEVNGNENVSSNLSRLMLKPSEISRDYNICRATVYRLIESGDLPHVKFRSAIRVPAESMEQFVHDQLNSAVA